MPSTTRATPEARSSSASSSERTPPPNSHTDPVVGHQPDDLGQHVALVRDTGARAVEVDDVDPAGAALDVAGRQRGGVPVLLLTGEVALGQAHGRSAAQVDGRQEVHHAPRCPLRGRAPAASRTKLARSASPVAPDFSGWNWAPQSVPRAASAATGPP